MNNPGTAVSTANPGSTSSHAGDTSVVASLFSNRLSLTLMNDDGVSSVLFLILMSAPNNALLQELQMSVDRK